MTKDEELTQMTLANKFLTGVVDIYHNLMDRKKVEAEVVQVQAQVPFSVPQKEIVVRYIHMPDSYPRPGATGMTVAYARNEKNLVFAWSYVIGKDVYSKEIGRERSSKNLKDAVDGLENGLSFRTFIDPANRVGNIKFDQMYEMVDLSNVLSDDLLEKMNYMHFKHAFLTRLIKEMIFANIS